MKKEITELSAGAHFNFKGYEWIILDNNVDGGVLAIMASAWNGEEYCFNEDGNNNYAKSSLRRKLLNELLPILGEDNLIPREVDLVADNGDDRYGTVTDRVFILSCDEYRKYRKNIPLLHEWMWTCTPWYISDAGSGYGVRSVSSTGGLNRNGANSSYGVAPACVFNPEKINLEYKVEITEKKFGDKMSEKEMLDYLLSTGLYERGSKKNPYGEMYYEQQMLQTDKTIPIKELVERFIEIDKEFRGKSWNIMQILSNINMIIPVEDKK